MEWLAGLVIVLGIIGVVVPLLPGLLLVGAAVVGYAVWAGDRVAWIAAGACVAILVVGWVAKWVLPARRVSGDVSSLALAVGGVCALVGFFLVPFLGAIAGFVVGVLATETARTRSLAAAWPATRQAIAAAGLSLLVELAAAVCAGALWVALMVFY